MRKEISILGLGSMMILTLLLHLEVGGKDAVLGVRFSI